VVTKGYVKKRTSDFISFFPTTTQVTLRVILVRTVVVGFKRWDLDVTCVFTIEEYPLPKGKVLKLLRAIYGLIQASLAFLTVVIQGLHKSRIHSIEV
jgi:hypothetical protein